MSSGKGVVMNRGSSVMVLGSSWVAASFLGGLIARSTAPDRASVSVPAAVVAPVGAKAEPAIARLIEAREFRLVDGDGQPRARLEVDRGTARLVFNGSERDTCSASIGASDTAATVSLHGSGSELTLGMTPGVSAMVE